MGNAIYHTTTPNSMTQVLDEVPLVSVCVRAHNDILYLKQVLDMLLQQEGCRYEILVCDDFSNDGSAELLDQYPTLIRVQRPKGAYVPGKTLNALVAAAHGELIVFHNADALPVDTRYLRALTTPLLASSSTTATFARQSPHTDATPFVQRDYDATFGENGLAERLHRFFSLVGAAMRRDDLVAYPFDEHYQYSEDVAWAQAAIERGGWIVYVQDAEIMHSHNYTLRQRRMRYYNEGYADGQLRKCAPSYLHASLGALLDVFRDIKWALRKKCFWTMIGESFQVRLCQRLRFAYGAQRALKGAER